MDVEENNEIKKFFCNNSNHIKQGTELQINSKKCGKIIKYFFIDKRDK